MVAASYSPLYGIIGNGSGLIYNQESNFAPYPAGGIGIANTQEVIPYRPVVAVSGGVITIASNWVFVDNSAGDVTVSQINLASGFNCDSLYIQPLSSSFNVTLSVSGGNIRTPGAINVVMSEGINDLTHLNRLASTGRWRLAR
ncbi:hypothetical protein D9M71_556250 [compost metagenome]